MDKRTLYEHIMQNVAIEVKKALNEDIYKPSAFVLKTLQTIKNNSWRNLPDDDVIIDKLSNNENMVKTIMKSKFLAAGPVSNGITYSEQKSDEIEIEPHRYIRLHTEKTMDTTSRNPMYRGTSKTRYYIYLLEGGMKKEIAMASSGATKYSSSPAEAKIEAKVKAILYLLNI